MYTLFLGITLLSNFLTMMLPTIVSNDMSPNTMAMTAALMCSQPVKKNLTT